MIGTQFNLIDQSAITRITNTQEVDDSPVILTAMASAKGTEDWFDIKSQYTEMFGEPNFRAYGQASIQNRRMIDAGARLVGKRLVADDSALANIIIVAKLYKTEVQKTDTEGLPLYYDALMQETTTVSEDPVMIVTANIRYEAAATTGAKTLDQVIDAANEELDIVGTPEASITVFSYPLFAFTDNGRCVSKKRLTIVPEISLSKNLSFMFYNVSISENGASLQSARFAAVPDTIYHGENIELTEISNSYATQFKAHSFSDNIKAFTTKLAEFSLIEDEVLSAGNLLFGGTVKGNAYPSIVIDTENGIDLQSAAGISLVNGSNGMFGDSPFTDPVALAAYNTKLLEFFNGTETNDIYNVDQYQIDAIFDANFPINVKNEVATLAGYRKDLMYYRDLGLANYTLDDIKTSISGLIKSPWVTDFCQAYEILDPYSKRSVKVTEVYTISGLMIDHLKNSRNIPFAGEANQAILTDAKKGTITFLPTVNPTIDEKTELEDLRVNFASYFTDRLIIETLYTAQAEYTQLSFSNNVLALQRVLKVMRKTFPSIRYQFISNEDDLRKYTARINEVISAYVSDFEELTFTYIQDTAMLANKIFRAAISFRFKDFAQAEIIDAYILPTASAV